MKKSAVIILAILMAAISLAGCGGTPQAEPAATQPAAQQETQEQASTPQEPTVPDASITVVSREEGSGTRGAFIELLGIEQKDADGNTVDYTTVDAEIGSGQSVILTLVSNNPNAIGYVSLGALNETVRAIEIDDVDATVDNIKNGSYKVARPFNIAVKDGVSEAAQAFIDFIMSAEGQAIVENNKYISAESGAPFAGSTVKGKVVVSGSTSVAPLMEKLAEAYQAINPNAEIEVHHLGSTAGMTNTIEGVCDIGMASRELKDSEKEAGLNPVVIALDGIAVIVHKTNGIKNLTMDQVRAIYMGELTHWSETK